MNSDKNKRENRKALKIFIPVMIAAAVTGGVIGGFSTTGTAEHWTAVARTILKEVMYFAAPLGVIIMTLAGTAIAFAYYRKGKGYYDDSLKAIDEEAEDFLFRSADASMSKAILYVSACEILSLMLFAAVVTYIPEYVEKENWIYVAVLVVFTALLLFSFFFDYGPLPAMAVGGIWLAATVSYCKEAIRLEKEKINL